MMSQEKRTKSSGGAKPRTHLLPMMALVLVGLFALAGVVSADNYYKGDKMVTDSAISNVANAPDFWYKANNAWYGSDNPVTDSNTTTFTVPEAAINPVWARLWVVVYQGNMTANFYGNETIWLNNGGLTDINLTVEHQPLHLAYDNTQATHASPVPAGGYFVDLNRVTSDYVNEFDVTSLITQSTITVTAQTWNESNSDFQAGFGKFDGRIKAIVLAVGYDDFDESTDVYYLVNVGHDTVTKSSTLSYESNTTFTGLPSIGYSQTAQMDEVFLASQDGRYSYTNQSGGSVYSLPNQTPGVKGAYFGYDTWSIPRSGQNDITLFYNRSISQSYYKTFLTFLQIPKAS